VCAGIWILRRSDPKAVRPFRAPLVPLVPILGMAVCSLMIISLDRLTQLSALTWMLVGLDVYLLFGFRNSVLSKGEEAHHTFRGQKSASIAGIMCALFLLTLSMLDFYFKKQQFMANASQNPEPSMPWFFIVLGVLHLGIFTVSMMKRPKIA
jgi:APA family basic amino acid/polyamine antiporter